MVRTVFYDPNGALSRARDFLSVRKVESAVDVLQSFLNTMAKRNRPWDKMHEVVIHKCIDLCVRLGAANRAKDSLHQYRAICQQIAPNSLLNAVNYLIDSSRKKLAAAEQKFEAQKKLNAVRKLDKHSAVTTILSGVSLDSADDRLRHELVQPWVTFLRDNFRACLDLLRNLNQLQVQYHQIAASAFEFCVQYPHPKEFRILCDSIRRHYTQIQELNAKPESALLMWEKKHKENGVVMDQNFIERQLVTRFTQMEYAAKMNQWAEVWHTIKGVHDIIATAPREQRPSIRAEFYLKVSRVFQQAGNPLFRAYALARYYSLSKSYNETLSQSQLVEISSTVLLSTISITTAPKNVVYGVEKLHDKNQAIAVQLDFDPEPSRDALLADILQMGVLEDVAPPVRELYLCLEEEFTPLQLIDRFVAALDAIKSARKGRLANAIMLKSYHDDLEVLAVIRLLEHLSSVYDKFSIENFQALIAKAGISFAQVETIIARQCAEVSTSVNVQIDHRNGTLNFHSGGPEGERIHAQLSTLAARLHSVVQEIESPESKGARANLKADFFNRIRDALPNENARMQLRPDVIEKLKVAKEEQRYIEQVRKNADAAAAAEENAARIAASLAEQQRKREERREAIAEMEERRQQVKAYAVEKLGLEEARILVASLGNNLSEAEVDEAMLEVQKKKQKEEEVAAKKRRALRRHLDYTTRALREAQIPRVKAHYQKVAEENLRTAKEAISKEYVSRRKFWEEMHGRKQEILHIVDGVRAFHNELMQTRQAELQKQRRETNHRIRAQARMQRAIDEQAQRRRMKQLEAEAAEEEARQRAAFEAEEAQREAEEAAHREELARREAEEQAAARQANKYVPPTRRGQNPPQDNRGFGGSSGGRFGGEGGRFGDSRGFGGDSRGFGGERRGFGGDNRDSRGFGGSGSSRGQGRW